MMPQVGGALPTSPWELVTTSSTATQLILLVLALFSLAAWFLILMKWVQFRRVRKQGDRFFGGKRFDRAMGNRQLPRAHLWQPDSARLPHPLL